jgi:hypothetical protein
VTRNGPTIEHGNHDDDDEDDTMTKINAIHGMKGSPACPTAAGSNIGADLVYLRFFDLLVAWLIVVAPAGGVTSTLGIFSATLFAVLVCCFDDRIAVELVTGCSG